MPQLCLSTVKGYSMLDYHCGDVQAGIMGLKVWEWLWSQFMKRQHVN